MNDQIAITKEIIEQLAGFLDESAKVEYEESATMGHVFNVFVNQPYQIIGRQGTILYALEFLARQAVFKKLGASARDFRFIIDIDDYRRKREWYLKETAKQAATQAKRTEQPVTLEPMPSYERRVVHAYIQNNFQDMSSESVGNDPRRRIVIKKASR